MSAQNIKQLQTAYNRVRRQTPTQQTRVQRNSQTIENNINRTTQNVRNTSLTQQIASRALITGFKFIEVSAGSATVELSAAAVNADPAPTVDIKLALGDGDAIQGWCHALNSNIIFEDTADVTGVVDAAVLAPTTTAGAINCGVLPVSMALDQTGLYAAGDVLLDDVYYSTNIELNGGADKLIKSLSGAPFAPLRITITFVA